ncbi:MAG: peptidase [Labilithrix sp.]|nr:peptidase [Labilithrix sp.]
MARRSPISVALRILAACVLALAACAGPPPQPPPAPLAASEPATVLPPPREDGHLPALATPLHYALAFDIDPRAPTFAGTARIDVAIPAKTSHVVLDAHALNVTDARAIVDDAPHPARVSLRAAHAARTPTPEELVLTFDPPLAPGRATLVITYSAPFDQELSGLYRVADGGNWYAFTQFEATDARRAFPCFDEPGYKVPFEVSVTVPKGMLAVANTPELARDASGDKIAFRFAETPPLPTYLVALAVGELEIKELARTTKPPIRLITVKGKTAQGALGLEATSGLVDALATWFGIPYPYEKLDIVAVPEFGAGAMENAGLITFREELLLLDPARASVRSRRSQALVVAHELAHQWFGDLVTAAWWDDLWLNEGFATWMEWRIVDIWKPSFGAKNDAVVDQLGVMDVDALASARAVRQPVVSTSEADEAFDGITYEKGAAVLSTIERWIGEATFQRGVREYLTTNAFKSVHADRLFASLDRASGKDVTQMAATYLDRTGVPEVTAHVECDRGSRWHIELGQEAWRPLGSKVPEDQERAWTIPVCVLAQGEKKAQCADLAYGAPSIVAGRKCPTWVHPNAEGGYYRFALSETELTKLAQARAQLEVPARISLLSNAWAGVRAGKLKPAVMLKVLPLFDDDPARQVVEQITSILASMSLVLVEDDARPAFRKFVSARLAKRKKDLGWMPKKDEAAGGGDDAILRRSVFFAMGDLAEDEATLREADELAVKWLADPTSVDSDTAGVALDLATRHAGADRLTKLLATARAAKTKEDRVLALKALGGFDDAALLRRGLDASLEDEIRPHEMRYVMGAAFARRTSRMIAESWVRARWPDLRKKLPGALSASLIGAAGVACTKAEQEERAAFYGPRAAEIESAARPLAEALEAASLCAELRAAGASSLTRELLNGGGEKKPKK